MSDTGCPHCGHDWERHNGRCDCGCMWAEPEPPKPPPTARELLIARVSNAIWQGFEAEDNACVDRQMDLIDTGGSYETFRMERVAEHVLRAVLEVLAPDEVWEWKNQ